MNELPPDPSDLGTARRSTRFGCGTVNSYFLAVSKNDHCKNLRRRCIKVFGLAVALSIAIPAAIAQSGKLQAPKNELSEILALRTPYETALNAVVADREKKLKNLDYIYMLNVEKLQKDCTAAGDLRGALAAKAELERLGPRQEITDEQRKAMSPPLQKLMANYDGALKFYLADAAKSKGALLQKLLADLESLQRRITTTGDLQKALVVLTEKERIAVEAAQARPAPAVADVVVTPQPTKEPPKAQPPVNPSAPDLLVRVFTKQRFEKALTVGMGKGTIDWKIDSKGNIEAHSSSYGLPALVIFGNETENATLKATMQNSGYSRSDGQGLVLCLTKEVKEDDGFHGSPAIYARYHEGVVELLNQIPYHKAKEKPVVLASAQIQIDAEARYTLQLDVSGGSKVRVAINDKQVLEYLSPVKLKGRYALLASNGKYIFESVHGDKGATGQK